MAKHAKKLIGSKQPKLGTLETNEGTNTDVGEETFNELMNKHYPTHTKAKLTTHNKNNQVILTELMTMYKNWINTNRVAGIW